MSFKNIAKFRFEKRVEHRNMVGNNTVPQVQQSKKQKLDDPRRQRKQKKWRLDLDE